LSFLRSFWGSLAGLIALMIVLDRAGGASKVLGSAGSLVKSTVTSFK
jgi:hypothetical protein